MSVRLAGTAEAVFGATDITFRDACDDDDDDDDDDATATAAAAAAAAAAGGSDADCSGGDRSLAPWFWLTSILSGLWLCPDKRLLRTLAA